MSVRKRTWRDKHGRQHTRWMIHVHHTWPDGRKQSIRKVSPVQTRRGAEAYEREVRKQLVSGSWKEGDRKQTPTLKGFAEEFLAYQKTLNKPSELANKEMILRVHHSRSSASAGSIRSTSGRSAPTRSRSSNR